MPENNLSKDLIFWYSTKKRSLPWRETRDPYRIWISEIILQQTRIQQGLPYYERFTQEFPDVHSLANSEEEKVLKLWEGLGYYSRARNMLVAARQVMSDWGGEFPNNYQDLLKLKGVGDYTASAIASICFGEPEPVVDGNVFRVVSRLFEISTDISSAKARSTFKEILHPLISKNAPDQFNQGLMELGATICLPRKPSCDFCPLNTYCQARENQTQHDFPVKLKKVKIRERAFHYYVIRCKKKIGLRKRSKGDIWQGLYEFYLVEGTQNLPQMLKSKLPEKTQPTYIEHKLTHQTIKAYFYSVDVAEARDFNNLMNILKLEPYCEDELVNLPRPKLIISYLDQLNQKII